ncbi:hypothetical protein Bbelb_071560 [Branchiostoma belcheri]|nr:hypothetical protein Bbelb_071560 [Branchiostoma belcheri]
MVERCVDAHLSPSKPVRYTASTLPNYAHWRTQHARHVFFQARRMNIPVNTSNHQYCSSKRAEENLKGNGENVRNDDTYTTRHKRCRSPALNEQVSTRNDHNMSNVIPYLSSCVLLFCQPVFSDHYTAHIMYEKRAKAHSCRHNAKYPMHDVATLVYVCYHLTVRPRVYAQHRARDDSDRDSDKTASTTHTACHVCYRSTILTRVNAQTGPKNTQAGTVTNTTCTTKRSHRSPCVLPLDCPYPSVPNNTQTGTVKNTTCTTKGHTARDVCCRSTALPECTKEHSLRDSDEHNMHDEKITPPAMSVYRSLLPSKCTKEHLRENSNEHNMTTKRSHRPPCVSTAHCSHRSVPKNTSERTVTNTT